jgi:hypothetical protein
LGIFRSKRQATPPPAPPRKGGVTFQPDEPIIQTDSRQCAKSPTNTPLPCGEGPGVGFFAKTLLHKQICPICSIAEKTMAYKVYDPAYLNGLHKPLTEEELSQYRKLKNVYFQKTPYKSEWLRKICDQDGTTQFRIKYFGEIQPSYPYLIVGKNFNSKIEEEEYEPPRVIAENADTGNEILLFDLALHGYNAIFCSEYVEFKDVERKPTQRIVDKSENDLFEVFVSIYYNIDFDQEFGDEVDEDGNIEMYDGKVNFETAKTNSFDWIHIHLKNGQNKWLEIIDFELA